jgi:hypothetical protein
MFSGLRRAVLVLVMHARDPFEQSESAACVPHTSEGMCPDSTGQSKITYRGPSGRNQRMTRWRVGEAGVLVRAA